MSAPIVCQECGNDEAAADSRMCSDCLRGPTYCRFLGTEQCRGGLNIADHALETSDNGRSRWRHPDGLDSRGYHAFGDKAVIRR